jgi:hypothetical protein
MRTSRRQDEQRVVTVQNGFACIKLKDAKGSVAEVQLQLLLQQLPPLMRDHHGSASALNPRATLTQMQDKQNPCNAVK